MHGGRGERHEADRLAVLRAHGRGTTSFQTLGLCWWGDDAGGVGFVEVGRAWVAAGGPVGAPGDASNRVAAFCAAAPGRVCFFAAEDDFPISQGWVRLKVGEQPVWDPRAWPATVAGSRSLREQLRRARAKGVVVTSWAAEQVRARRDELDALQRRWQATRPMAPMGFVVDLDPVRELDERRTFVAERDGRCVAMLSLVPVYARQGWFFEHLLRDPTAPNGTTELLVDVAMRAVAAEGAVHVTLGMAPLAGVDAAWLRAARALSRPLYDFDGLRAFKQKLRPDQWEPVYLVYPRGGSPLLAMYDVLRAFARGSYLRFGLATALHSSRMTALTLGALLVPWTLLLATADTARWFPSLAVQRAWTVFDVFMAAGLLSLGWRWRRSLATVLAALATADALLTTLEAWASPPSPPGFLAAVIVSASIAAPTLAAAFLWRAR
jgi:phosphatidylglycerol lysyltransferase